MGKKGFTLLEIIVVIIIVGVLAAVALPRFFRVIEFSRAAEARVSLGAIRQGLERCYLMRNGTYAGCTTFSSLGMEDPGNSPNAHFSYILDPNPQAAHYTVVAQRNTRDGGSSSSSITVRQQVTGVDWWGYGAFEGIQ